MEINEVGVFKYPGGACPLAFEMFKQMKRQPKELVTIRKSRKMKPVPALRVPPRQSIVLEQNGILPKTIGKMDFYRPLRLSFI